MAKKDNSTKMFVFFGVMFIALLLVYNYDEVAFEEKNTSVSSSQSAAPASTVGGGGAVVPPANVVPPPVVVCTDTDGGKDYGVFGEASTNYGQPGYAVDECWEGMLHEYYCRTNGAITYETYACPAGTSCWAGYCKKPDCSTLVNAASQEECDAGEAPAGATCKYWGGTGCWVSY